MSELHVWRCDRCGHEMIERHCKVLCPNCGARWDCSDVTIWVGDSQPSFQARRLRADDYPALRRKWADIPSLSALRDDASGAWLLLQGRALRGYAALFPVPGLPGMHHLQGAVDEDACQNGAGQLWQALLRDVDRQRVRQITFAVDSLQERAARFLQARGFRLEHEEWQMEGDLPPPAPTGYRAAGYQVRTLPYAGVVAQFLRLYEQSFSGAAWYQPYSRSEVAAELEKAEDILFLWHGDAPVGFAWLRAEGQVGEVEPIGLIPAHQGRGAGRALFMAALQRLSERGLRRVRVGVWRQNERAVSLYRSVGLQQVARRYYLAYDLDQAERG